MREQILRWVASFLEEQLKEGEIRLAVLKEGHGYLYMVILRMKPKTPEDWVKLATLMKEEMESSGVEG